MISILSNVVFRSNTGIPITGTVKFYKQSTGEDATETYSDAALGTQTNEFSVSGGVANVYCSSTAEAVFAKAYDGDGRLVRVFPNLNTLNYDFVVKNVSDGVVLSDVNANTILVLVK